VAVVDIEGRMVAVVADTEHNHIGLLGLSAVVVAAAVEEQLLHRREETVEAMAGASV